MLINTIFAGKPLCNYNCVCPWYETEHLVLTPRRYEEEEEVDLDPEQLTIVTQEERNMAHARGDSMLKLTGNRKTLIHRASEQAEVARTVEMVAIPYHQLICCGWKLFFFYAENTQSQGILDMQEYTQFLTIT